MSHSLLASSTGYSNDNKWKKLYTTGFQNIKKALVIQKIYVACLKEFPKDYWMQRHNFSAIKQKYRERNCNMEGTVAQNSTSCFVPWRKGLGIQR